MWNRFQLYFLANRKYTFLFSLRITFPKNIKKFSWTICQYRWLVKLKTPRTKSFINFGTRMMTVIVYFTKLKISLIINNKLSFLVISWLFLLDFWYKHGCCTHVHKKIRTKRTKWKGFIDIKSKSGDRWQGKYCCSIC